ncbi:protein of unknown function [Trichlorobacter ammonificans]|uniref:Uncharacterized protein n=1 Tax=Trichlorobacter ammonificans TaxID=2916410 RepID=A0ABM9D8V0_9BACT|nr:protein of unknown function [Trichlorobacter ammonificans]
MTFSSRGDNRGCSGTAEPFRNSWMTLRAIRGLMGAPPCSRVRSEAISSFGVASFRMKPEAPALMAANTVGLSSKMVYTMISVAGQSSFTRSISSAPCMPGSPRSTSRMSGRSRSSVRSASSALPKPSTAATSGSASRVCCNASSVMALSSTIARRIVSPGLPVVLRSHHIQKRPQLRHSLVGKPGNLGESVATACWIVQGLTIAGKGGDGGQASTDTVMQLADKFFRVEIVHLRVPLPLLKL